MAGKMRSSLGFDVAQHPKGQALVGAHPTFFFTSGRTVIDQPSVSNAQVCTFARFQLWARIIKANLVDNHLDRRGLALFFGFVSGVKLAVPVER